VCTTILFLGIQNPRIISLGWFKLKLADRLTQSSYKVAVVTVVVLFLVQLALLAGHLLLFSQWAFTRARDLAGRRQAGFGEALLWRKIIIFNERLAIVIVQFLEKPTLHKADLALNALDCNRLELWRFRHDDTSSSSVAVEISKESFLARYVAYLLSCLA
jgi:hypothetical protein